jgi:hypothetical protein
LAEFQNQLMEQMAQQGRERAVPSLENSDLKIFALKSLPAPHAANAIEDLFGSQAIRVSIDDRSNSLVVLGKPDSIKVIEALLMNLDQKPAKGSDKKQPQSSKSQTSRPLQLHLFWLADGTEFEVGKDPTGVLPASVLRATKKLGLATPRLITQAVNSLAASVGDPANFSATLPALLKDRSVTLQYGGKLSVLDADKSTLAMHIDVAGVGLSCNLEGSLSTPLGHYTVLGTANSVAPEGPLPKSVPGAKKPDGAVPEGEFGINPAADPTEAATPQQAAQPTFSTYRFAFVVQLIEGESYPPEDAVDERTK